MAAQIKPDYGNKLLGADCLDPRTRDLKFGTNQFYNDYCSNVLQLNSIRHTSSSSPYFESFLNNAGITFRPAEFPNLYTQIYTDGNSMNVYTKSQNTFSLLKTNNSASLLTIQDTVNNKIIELDSADIVANTNVYLRNWGTTNNPIYVASNANGDSYLPNLGVRYADIASNASSAFRATQASYATYSFYSEIARDSSYSLVTADATRSSYAAYAGTANNAGIAIFANNAGTASYALTAAGGTSYAAVAGFSINGYAATATNAQYASYSDTAGYALSTPGSSYATIAAFSLNGYAATATNAQYAAYSNGAGYAGTATNAQYAAYAANGLPAGFTELPISVCVGGTITSKTFLVK
jgi:hypothetical protein